MGDFGVDVRREEAISALGNGLDVAGVLGIITQRLPQFANGNSEAAIEVDKRIVAPDAMAQVVAGNHLSGVFQKNDQKPEWLLLQLYPVPVFPEFARVAIHLERAEPIERTTRRVHVSPRSPRSTRAVHRVYQPARQFTTYIELSHSQ